MTSSRLDSLLQAVRRLSGEPAREQNDGQLLRRFVAEQDETAYTELMSRHGGMVLRVCRRVLSNAHDAEDAFQSTFLTLARKAASVCKEHSLGSWLYGVAHRTALRVREDVCRRRVNEARVGVRVAPDPLGEITVREAQRIFDDELAGLPDHFRAPLVLCYLEGKTQDEAAQELGWSLATLRRRVKKGRDALGKRFARRGLTLGTALAVGLPASEAASAAVPPTLLELTSRAAVLLASGQSIPKGLVSAKVVLLTISTTRVLTMTKFKTLTLAMLVFAFAGAGTVALALVSATDPTRLWASEPVPAVKPEKKEDHPPPARRVAMGRNVFLEIQGQQRRAVINAVVCLREGPLEMLLTRKGTKEHEAVLTAEIDARDLHKALLLTNARVGEPVKFDPKCTPASGQTIKVTVSYEEKGKTVTLSGQEFVRDSVNKKVMTFQWVFAGSRLVKNPLDDGKPAGVGGLIFLANEGDVVCVANFESALLDVAVKSPKDNNDLLFEANTEKIPPVGTKVTVIFEPVPEAKR